ncbi:MAG: hypothetical protein NTW85_16145 [Methylococcales bacterium]|nr:hypothetical protein [Methylococcales bacterium]
MVTYAFDLGIWTLLFFIIGMYKPQWPLFFLKKSDESVIEPNTKKSNKLKKRDETKIESDIKKPASSSIEPSRFMIVVITTIFVMITFTLYGEGTRREKLAKQAITAVSKNTDANSTPVPVPVPTTDKITPEKKPL